MRDPNTRKTILGFVLIFLGVFCSNLTFSHHHEEGEVLGPFLLAQADEEEEEDKYKDMKFVPPTPSEPFDSDEEGEEEGFGYISLTIFPGFKSISLNKETTVGMSEMILVPQGTHWVEITSPAGYADSSFKVDVKQGEIVKKEVHLRNLVTGEFAVGPANPEKKGPNWKNIAKITSFSVGTIALVMAINYERLARDSEDRYNKREFRNGEDYNSLYSEWEDNASKRNGMGVLSILGLGAGVVLWRF